MDKIYIVYGISHILSPEAYIVGEKLNINADINPADKNNRVKYFISILCHLILNIQYIIIKIIKVPVITDINGSL